MIGQGSLILWNSNKEKNQRWKPKKDNVRHIYLGKCPTCVQHMKEYASDGYSGQRSRTVAIKYSWLTSRSRTVATLLTLIFKNLTPATATGRQPLYETQILCTSHGYGTSVTVRDFSHCTTLRNTISVTGHWRILSYVCKYVSM